MYLQDIFRDTSKTNTKNFTLSFPVANECTIAKTRNIKLIIKRTKAIIRKGVISKNVFDM